MSDKYLPSEMARRKSPRFVFLPELSAAWKFGASRSALLAFFALLVLQNVSAEVTPGELSFRKMVGVDASVAVTYENEAGVGVSYSDFRKLVADGKRFLIVKNPQTQTTVFAINSPETKSTKRNPLEELSVSIGSPMPVLKLKGTDGREYSWDKFSGKLVLLNFFFAECPPCIQEIPELNEFAKRHRDIDVLSVTFESQTEARKFASKHKFEWPMAPDAKAFIDAIGIKSYPTAMLISGDRKLIGVKFGANVPLPGEKFTAKPLDQWVSELRTRSK